MSAYSLDIDMPLSICEKYTTVKCIERFFDFDNGKVFIHNFDIREYNVGWLWIQIGYVEKILSRSCWSFT